VVRDQVQFFGGLTVLANVGGSDGNDDLAAGSTTEESAEGSLSDDVVHDSGLVLLGQEWNLEAQFVVLLPGVDGVEVSLELEVLEVILNNDLKVSTERNMDGHDGLVVQWETEDGGELNGELGEAEGLLVVDFNTVLELGESLSHEFWN